MALVDVLAGVSSGSPEAAIAQGLDFSRLPKHVAVIMDGNGRWAAERHLPRVEGHRAGIESVRETVETSARLGLSVLTLYAFSVENWKRPVPEVTARTAPNTGMVFNIALSYGGRAEIVDAARQAIARGLTPEQLDEDTFASFLYTAGQPDPDLLIRTSGEMRVSNFLLWQIAYAEIWVTDTFWPDFRARHLLEAVADYQKRDRRYGAVSSDTVEALK